MNFMSYEHLVEECPTIPVVREMFGDCNTYNSNWRDHPNFSWKPQPPQYQQHVQATQQALNLEQAMVNLSKVVGDFVGAQKSINAHLSQRIDSVESSLNKRMDEVQNDLSQKIDNLQDSISRFANLNTVQEKGNLPSQPYKNSKGIHEVEAKKGESSMVKEVKTVITLSGGIAKMMKEKEEKREFWPLVLLPLWDIFWSTSSSPFYTYYIPFRSSGIQETNASNGIQIGVETKKLWSLQENWTELSGNFAHLNPRCENFCIVRNTSWHTSAISHTSSPFSHRAKQGANSSVQSMEISHDAIQDNYAKLNGNGAAAANFTTVRHVFGALPGAQIIHTIYHFEAWEVRNPVLQTVYDLDLKRRSYGRLKTDYTKLSGNFAP
ncbi:hypothetical protein CK203_052786 [Vitis vinifera]|uniref:Uncharacterized protein n=1 Tax=Vitis vinifera TaxID=29760 RepID=A0A438FUS2_VITVI|nr:hypothetical protein CK203_052786 [Vitis vinifera]